MKLLCCEGSYIDPIHQEYYKYIQVYLTYNINTFSSYCLKTRVLTLVQHYDKLVTCSFGQEVKNNFLTRVINDNFRYTLLNSDNPKWNKPILIQQSDFIYLLWRKVFKIFEYSIKMNPINEVINWYHQPKIFIKIIICSWEEENCRHQNIARKGLKILNYTAPPCKKTFWERRTNKPFIFLTSYE